MTGRRPPQPPVHPAPWGRALQSPSGLSSDRCCRPAAAALAFITALLLAGSVVFPAVSDPLVDASRLVYVGHSYGGSRPRRVPR